MKKRQQRIQAVEKLKLECALGQRLRPGIGPSISGHLVRAKQIQNCRCFKLKLHFVLREEGFTGGCLSGWIFLHCHRSNLLSIVNRMIYNIRTFGEHAKVDCIFLLEKKVLPGLVFLVGFFYIVIAATFYFE